jgi:HEAT repeat protein
MNIGWMRWGGVMGLGLMLALTTGEVSAKPTKDQVRKATEVLEKGTRSGDFDTRATAVAGLGKADRKVALPLVTEALKDPQWKVRRAAIEALRELGDKRADEETGRAICDAAIPEGEVLVMLGALKLETGTKLLTDHLGKKECARPERYPKALAERGDALMVPTFKAALASKFDALRLPFEAELGQLPLPAALPLFKAAFPKASAGFQARLIERLAAAEAVTDVEFVAEVLKSKDPANHFAAAELLALRGNGKGRAVLGAAVTGADASLRVRALTALEKVATEVEFELVKPLIKDRETPYDVLKLAYLVYVKSDSQKLGGWLEAQLASTDAPQRAAAVRFLGRAKGRAALDELHRLLTGTADMVRESAIDALGELAARESIPHLRKALDLESNRDFKIRLLNALAAIKDVEVLPVVRFQLVGSDLEVRKAALRALVAVPDRSSIPDLEAAAKDRHKEIREFALNALLDMEPGSRVELWTGALDWIDPPVIVAFAARHTDAVQRHLEVALMHKRDEVRAAAFRALSHLTVPVRVAVLEALVRGSKRPEQRVEAVDLLVSTQQADAATFLVTQSASGDEVVRVRAIGHLGRLGHKGAETGLIGWLDDPSERVQIAAAAAALRL